MNILLGGKRYRVVDGGPGKRAWLVEGVPGRRGGGPHVGEQYYLRPTPSGAMLTASPGEDWAPRNVYLTPSTSKGTKDMRGDEKRHFPFDEMALLQKRASHEMTEGEARKKLLQALDFIAESWASVEKHEDLSYLERTRGVIHSVLVLLDGESMDLPAFDLIPRPHPEDMGYRQERGENWWPPYLDQGGVAPYTSLNKSEFLHDAWQDHLARRVTAQWFRQAFNKYNAPEVLSQLLKALYAAGLDDVAHRLQQLRIPKIVNDAWRRRES